MRKRLWWKEFLCAHVMLMISFMLLTDSAKSWIHFSYLRLCVRICLYWSQVKEWNKGKKRKEKKNKQQTNGRSKREKKRCNVVGFFSTLFVDFIRNAFLFLPFHCFFLCGHGTSSHPFHFPFTCISAHIYNYHQPSNATEIVVYSNIFNRWATILNSLSFLHTSFHLFLMSFHAVVLFGLSDSVWCLYTTQQQQKHTYWMKECV